MSPLDARVPRRRAVAGAAGAAAAAGISTLVLPRAAAAASPPLEPTLADGSVPGAFRRSGDVDGTATTYLVLTHTGTEGEDSVYDLVLSSPLTGVDGVIVAGGGAGGAGRGAGGGAGGVARPEAGVTLAVGTYRVTVGGGGVAVRVDSSSTSTVRPWSRGGSGRASSIVAISGGTDLSDAAAVGGGGGGAEPVGQRTGADGGSGGGGGGYGTTTEFRGGSGTSGQGSAGAAANSTRTGGGGGAGQTAGLQNVRRLRETGNTTARNTDGGDGST